METFLFLVTYITNLAGFYIIKSNRRIGKEKKSVYDVLNAYLENGLKIILHKIPEVKTVSCGLWVKQGSSYESDEFNGLSHLAEHLLMNAEDVINEQYKYLIAEITDNGVMYNAATTKEYTCFHFTGLANTLETCICALAHIAMKNRNFENENFENEKKVVLQEATGFYSSFQQIKERTSQALWGNMGTGKIIMGNMNNIREATPEQIKGLVRRAYVPENTSIVVIGNIEYMHVLELIERELSSNAEHNILEFIKNNAKIKRNITISWFGGEPLLKFADIKRMLHKACQYGDEYGCKITSDITTNGYLLNEQNIREMKQLNVKSIQITIDGDRESHNKRRYLAGAGETYDKIKENLIKVSEQNIFVILRINIDEKNVDTATNILSEIPEQYRSNIAVNVANLYQIKDKISTYQIYKKAIELGYQYIERKNQYIACHTCFSEGYVVDTDANVIICANAVEDKILGRIDEKGKVCITNPKVRYQLKTASMIKNPNCRKCIQLPFCISTCKKAIYKENVICQGKRANGLSIEEIAKLDYLYDKKCMEYREKTA